MLQITNFDLHLNAKKFLKHLSRQNYSLETITGYGKDLEKFCKFIFTEYGGNILTSEVTKEDIQDYLTFLKRMEFKPNSVARHLSTLKSFYKFLIYEMNFERNAAAGIKHPKNNKMLPSALTKEELDQLFRALEQESPYFEAFFKLMYSTGSRITALRTTLKKNVDLQNKQIYFPKVKYNKELYLPLNNEILPILERHLFDHRNSFSEFLFESSREKNKPISAGLIRLKLTHFRQLAGIERHVHPHMIRHTTATQLTLKKVHQKEIASIMGHSDLRSTATYQHLVVDDLRDSINKL
ncbi:tyrosine-type recombinase/integrase [Bacillus sp. MUM 13]|uniref:tyrosine-type recombinase/integrase n=1 Tax=Bacillus sp. MUM 13 TaxID=1678001 RepID=UPI0008F56172|nr:tyrosine-type recombinase/integrase [Bacillus sp. MUM 13]OIK08807.1 hypothetical protein BIV59_18660 [Bacillus sp. MUM 13]